jgi:hypothetical protein
MARAILSRKLFQEACTNGFPHMIFFTGHFVLNFRVSFLQEVPVGEEPVRLALLQLGWIARCGRLLIT